MNINNRKVAAVFRIMAAFISMFAILNDFGVFENKFVLGNIFYFTTISNVFSFKYKNISRA